MKSYEDAAEFHRFFEEHHRTLARLAYLLVGDTAAADDLTADAFVATWRRWERVRATGDPLVAVRRKVIEAARRAPAGERGANGRNPAAVPEGQGEPAAPSAPGVRVTLRRLSPRRRACAALRCAFDLPEDEVAAALGVSARTVKKETARATAAFEKAVNARRSPRAGIRAGGDEQTTGGAHAANRAHPADGDRAGEGVRGRKGVWGGKRVRGADGGRVVPDWLRFALYREAYAHEPDRARMRARVAAALRARVTRRARIRMAAAGGMAVAIAAIAVVALPRISGSNAPPDPAGSSPPAIPQPNGSAVVMVRPGRPAVKVSARVDGSTNDHWSQNVVDVTSDRPLTGLRVTLRVARTPGTHAAGSWLSLSPDDFAITADHDARTLVYRWTLKPGRTVPSGTFTFAGQYRHRPGRREFRQDVYAVTGSGGSGRPVTVTGHF